MKNRIHPGSSIPVPPLLPEHQKLKDLNGANQIVGDFIEWLSEELYSICKVNDGYNYVPINLSRDELIAKHFGIDAEKLEAEKQQILDGLGKL